MIKKCKSILKDKCETDNITLEQLFEILSIFEDELLHKYKKMEKRIMAKIDDLNSAITTLQTTTDTVVTKINELKTGSVLDPQIESATNNINDVVTKLNSAIA